MSSHLKFNVQEREVKFPKKRRFNSGDLFFLVRAKITAYINLRLKGKQGPPARGAAPKGLGLTARERQRTAAGRLPEGEGCFS